MSSLFDKFKLFAIDIVFLIDCALFDKLLKSCLATPIFFGAALGGNFATGEFMFSISVFALHSLQ